MRWRKKGLVFCPNGTLSWAVHSALTPTPLLISADVIRVYCSFRDHQGIGRLGYVDVDAKNPSRVLDTSSEPVLDTGMPGMFDDNGMILGEVIRTENLVYMYYVGFQIVQKAKFLAFTGLAVSRDGGNSFVRYSQAPILDRAQNALTIRALHCALVEDGIWRVWYAAGSDWQKISGRDYPRYNIRYMESSDGVHFPAEGKVCVDVQGSEYRIGRPRVIKTEGLYQMFYTRGTLEGDYLAGYAESRDGIGWIRKDQDLGIGLSVEGWDSTALSYPSLLSVGEKVYMFYNGNDMGKTGFGYAVLEQE